MVCGWVLRPYNRDVVGEKIRKRLGKGEVWIQRTEWGQLAEKKTVRRSLKEEATKPREDRETTVKGKVDMAMDFET